MNADSPNAWTIAYRKPRANRLMRVDNWSGTWAQAHYLARDFSALHPELQVWCVTSYAYDADTQERVAAGALDASYAEDCGNVLVDSGRRVRMVERGSLTDAELALILSPDTAQLAWNKKTS